MSEKPRRKKKQQYLTVHVHPAKKLKHTIQVSIPLEYWDGEGIPEIVAIAIRTATARMVERAKGTH